MYTIPCRERYTIDSMQWYTMQISVRPKGERHARKCNGGSEYHRYEDMRRLYIRNESRVFVAVGWICPYCHDVHLDEGFQSALNR